MVKRTAKAAKLDEETTTTTTTTTAAASASASAAGGVDYETDLVSLNKFKVSELKEKLEALGLDGSGKKPELVARLHDHFNSKSSTTTTTTTTTATAKKTRVEAEVAPEKVEAEEAEEDTKPKRGARGKKAVAEVKPEADKEPASTSAPMNVEEKKPQKASEVLAAAAAAKKAAGKGTAKAKVDDYVPGAASYQVHEDYACMLNQTNSANNNNKFYVIQVLVSGGSYSTYNRWGRVGEKGQDSFKHFGSSAAAAISDFESKFKDKTSNKWSERADFTPRSGKYTLIEMDHEEDDSDATKLSALNKLAGTLAKSQPKVRPCTLPAPVQDLLKFIFDHDMFKHAMSTFQIDVAKMPLGKLSIAQLGKGYACLEEIGDEIANGASGSKLAKLSDTFFTLIPHSFGRQRPPVIATAADVQAKMDMLNVLSDIEVAQSMLNGSASQAATETEEVDHPLTANYKSLNARLTPVDKNSETYKLIETYTANTANTSWRKPKILDIFEVDRDTEGARFDVHKGITHRKLLWHGTNVAVVAAILKSGLRIMPHSGGRVGKGIYFADMNEKSSGYVGTAANNVGIMFLNEVALGKEKSITYDDSSLTAAPSGYDSVVARGRIMPDPKLDKVIDINGNKVIVPQATRINTEHSNSSFTHSEYLVYRENQCRIRYLLKIKFD